MSILLKNDLIITTYDTVRTECPMNLKMKSKRSGILHSIEWCRVVLDEGEFGNNSND
jgi:SNF2 family DNA or RNA helicase